MKVLNKATVEKLYKEHNAENLMKKEDVFLTKAARSYILAQGREFESSETKAEHITYICKGEMAAKTHPRIMLRGKLDSFQGKILEVQLVAQDEGQSDVLDELSEILEFTRKVLVCEVLNSPLEEINLFGYNQSELRLISQNPKKYFGIDHIPPCYKMGKLCVQINSLRTLSREVELAAVNAFCKRADAARPIIEREDILQGLNRLSSGVYIVYCKQLERVSYMREQDLGRISDG